MTTQRELGIDRVLSALFYIDLLRSAGMWHAYPTGQELFASVDPLPQQIVLYAMVPLTAYYIFLDWPKIRQNIRVVRPAIWLLLTAIFASLALSVAPMASTRAFIATAIISLPPIFCVWRFGEAKVCNMVQKFFAFAVFVNFAYLVVFPQYAIMTGVLAGSARGMFIHKNIFAQFLAAAAIFLVPNWRGIVRYRAWDWILLASILLDLAMMLLAKSASGVLMLFVVGAAYGVLRSIAAVRDRALRILVLVSSLFIGFVIYIVAASGLFVAITDALGKDPTLTGRTKLWDVLYQSSLERPLFGFGFGVFRLPEVMAQYASYFGWEARSTHNTYLELVLTIGYPAAILFAVLVLTILFRNIMTLTPSSRWQMQRVLLALCILIGAGAEAGRLLAPTISWSLLLVVLSCNTGYAMPRRTRQPVKVRHQNAAAY